MKKLKTKYLIIGGGVSGLMFANQASSDDYIILEKENELGGYCRTIYQDGFIWDYAGHFFHFSDPNIKKFFELKINKDEIIIKDKITKIFFDNSVIDFPFQTNIHQLEKNKFIDCLYDLYFKNNNTTNESSFLEMLYSRYGKSITEMFLKPYNEKLYACDLNSLDKDAMGRFFPHAELSHIIANFKKSHTESYNSTFLYPKNGAISFINALADNLDKDKILLSQKVHKIDIDKKIVFTHDLIIEYECIINSSPWPFLLEKIDSDKYSKDIKKLSYNKVLVFNLGFDKKSQFKNIHWAYFPEKNINFYRVGFYDNILDSDRLSLYVEIGYNHIDEVNVQEQLELTLKNLKKVNIIDDHKLISYKEIIMNPAYVHIDNNLAENKKAIKSELSSLGVYSIGRYGDWKYCSIEDSMLDAIHTYDKIK